MLTMGSLFDGAGTMPFAAMLCGIKPVWSSEIEKFPCEVTKRRFPDVKQLGDVTKINGAEIEPVDIITFGSPCQDLSVAGTRAGLKGERSGLFMEAVRIIKEMRNATRNGADEPVRPRYAVWENVPGAYSSNGGEDFRAVLEELCRIADDEVSIPRPPQGRWGGAGAIMGDGYSVAWRTLDAQYWGVPQRRRRIWLVADFGGESAPEILFKREGLSRRFEESRKTWEGVAETAEGSVGGASVWDCRGNGDGRTAATLTGDHQNRVTDYTSIICGVGFNYLQGSKARSIAFRENAAPTIRATSRTAVVYAIGNGQADGTGLHEKVGSLNCMHDAQAVIAIDRAAFNQGKNAKYHIGINEDGVAQTVVSKGPGSVFCLQGNGIDRADTAGCNGKGVKANVAYTLNTIDRHAVCAGFQPWNSATAKGVTYNEDLAPTLQSKKEAAVHCDKKIRRLTPTECARLQGMPSWWCADIPHSDSAEYKMWGNGMALPNALYVMEGFAGKENAGNETTDGKTV